MLPLEKEILKEVHQISPLSLIASELLSMISKPSHSLNQIVKLVECDASLTANVLRVANSAIFSPTVPITSILRAVAQLGERIVLTIALDACAGTLLRKPLEGYESGVNKLWEHNLRTAIASKKVSEFSSEIIGIELAFTAGILHDIGKAILSDFLKNSASDILSKIDSNEIPDYLHAESEKLGIDHTTVGYQMAVAWGLPSPLPEVIKYHHSPSAADVEHRALTYAVHLGDIIAMMGGGGTGSDDLKYHLDEGFQEYIDLSASDLETVMLLVEEEFSEIKSSLFQAKEKSI